MIFERPSGQTWEKLPAIDAVSQIDHQVEWLVRFSKGRSRTSSVVRRDDQLGILTGYPFSRCKDGHAARNRWSAAGG
mgnify:CR=1 FL=1